MLILPNERLERNKMIIVDKTESKSWLSSLFSQQCKFDQNVKMVKMNFSDKKIKVIPCNNSNSIHLISQN